MPVSSILRNYADIAYSTHNDGGPLTAAPRQKFQFVVEFKSTVTTLQDQLDKLKLIIRTAEMPSFQFDTQVLNQYNRKRVIQTRANFKPKLSVVAYSCTVSDVSKLCPNVRPSL